MIPMKNVSLLSSVLRTELTQEQRIAFDMYFASLCSMQVHPGAGTKDHRKLTLEECRDMALDMISIRAQAVGG